MYFHGPSLAIIEPCPLCSLILKTDHENILLGGIHPQDIHLEAISGTTTLRTLRSVPFSGSCGFLFEFLFACFGLFGSFVYFFSNRCKSVSILCAKLMQSNFACKNRLSRSKCSGSLSHSRKNYEAVTLMQACILTKSLFFFSQPNDLRTSIGE